MTKITTRVVAIAEMEPGEQEQFVAWAWPARSRTTFDSQIIGYPRTVMFIAEDTLPVAYLPVQTTLMAEVLIPEPGLSKRAIAAILGSFDEALMKASAATGIGDVYTYLPHSETDYANKILRHGWKEVRDVRLFKKSGRVSQ